jgi:hypothetical protein
MLRRLWISLSIATAYQLAAAAIAWILMPHLNIHGSGSLNSLGIVLVILCEFPGVLLGRVLPDFWNGYGAVVVIACTNVVVFTGIGFLWLQFRAQSGRGLTSA